MYMLWFVLHVLQVVTMTTTGGDGSETSVQVALRSVVLTLLEFDNTCVYIAH